MMVEAVVVDPAGVDSVEVLVDPIGIDRSVKLIFYQDVFRTTQGDPTGLIPVGVFLR
jgi:hypothetical protein